MHLNLHGYIYKENDIAWILDGLTPRKGTIQTVSGNVYSLLMSDTNNVENFTNPLLFPLKSHAEIHVNQFLITPTPSISRSVTPTPTRTPRPLTPTPTPSSSFVNKPNLLKTSSATWTTSNATVDIKDINKLVVTSTADGIPPAQAYTLNLNPSDNEVKINTNITVQTGSDYFLNIDFEQGYARFGQISVYLSDGNETKLFNTARFHDSYRYFLTINTFKYNTIILEFKLFSNSNYAFPPPKGYNYTLNNLNLSHLRKHISPPPSNSSGYDDIVLSKNPIAYWSFKDNLNDSVGGNDLTLIGTAMLKADEYGNTLYLPSNYDVMSGATFTNNILLTSNFTLETWLNMSELVGYGTLIGTDVYGLQIAASNNVYMFSVNDGINNADNGTLRLYNGNDYHIVATIDEQKLVTYYINGVKHDSTGSITDSYNFQYLGTDPDVENIFGTLGNVAIYNRVLSQSEILENYEAGTTNYRYSSNIVIPSPTPSLSATPTPTPTPSSYGVVNSSYLAKMNPDGVADNSFNLNLDNYVEGISKSPSGKIYIAGEFSLVSGQTYSGIARLNSDSSLDTTFVNTNAFPVYSVREFADGSIYACGGFTTLDSTSIQCLAKLNSDGSLDTNFIGLTFTASVNSATVTDIINTSDGKYYIIGNFNTVNGNTYSHLARLNSDGTLDTSFVDVGIGGCTSMIQAQDGKIYIADKINYKVVRLDSTGVKDTGYTLTGASEVYGKIHQTLNGKIYVCGNAIFDSKSYTFMFRLNSDGTPDSTFNSIQLTNGFEDMIQNSSGKIYIVGAFSPNGVGYVNHYFMERLNSDGTVDSSYRGSIGIDQRIKHICLDNSDNIYIAGLF